MSTVAYGRRRSIYALWGTVDLRPDRARISGDASGRVVENRSLALTDSVCGGWDSAPRADPGTTPAGSVSSLSGVRSVLLTGTYEIRTLRAQSVRRGSRRPSSNFRPLGADPRTARNRWMPLHPLNTRNLEAGPAVLTLGNRYLPTVGVSDLLDDSQPEAGPVIGGGVACVEHILTFRFRDT